MRKRTVKQPEPASPSSEEGYESKAEEEKNETKNHDETKVSHGAVSETVFSEVQVAEIVKSLHITPFKGNHAKEERTAAGFLRDLEFRISYYGDNNNDVPYVPDSLKSRILLGALEEDVADLLFREMAVIDGFRLRTASWDQVKKVFLGLFQNSSMISLAIHTVLSLPMAGPVVDRGVAYRAVQSCVAGWSLDEFLVQAYLCGLPVSVRDHVDNDLNRTEFSRLDQWIRAAEDEDKLASSRVDRTRFRKNSWTADKAERAPPTASHARDRQQRLHDQSRDPRPSGSAPPPSSALAVASRSQQKN
jgi:hypothetical protein